MVYNKTKLWHTSTLTNKSDSTYSKFNRDIAIYVRDVDLGKEQTFHLVTSAHESSCLISSTGPGTISILVTKYVVVRLFTQSHHLPLHSLWGITHSN